MKWIVQFHSILLQHATTLWRMRCVEVNRSQDLSNFMSTHRTAAELITFIHSPEAQPSSLIRRYKQHTLRKFIKGRTIVKPAKRKKSDTSKLSFSECDQSSNRIVRQRLLDELFPKMSTQSARNRDQSDLKPTRKRDRTQPADISQTLISNFFKRSEPGQIAR